MIEQIRLPIPMWRAQYELLGGHRRFALIVVGYATLIVVATIGLSRIFSTKPLADIVAYVLNGMGFVQAVILLPGGCNAIYRSMLRDYESKMIESHRLTPMTNFEVTLGYLFGATLQIIVPAAVAAIAGAFLSAFAGLSARDWLVANLLLFSAALPLWALVVTSGMRPTKPISPGPFMFVAIPFGAGIIAVPGLGAITGAYAVVLAYLTATSHKGVPTQALLALIVFNFFLTGYWVYAAATKYRRPDLPVLNALRGVVLLAIWLAVAFCGVIIYDRTFRESELVRWDPDMIAVQWITSLIITIPVAAVVVIATAEARSVVANGRPPRDWTDRIPDIPYAVLIAVLVTGAFGAFGYLSRSPMIYLQNKKPMSLSAWVQDPDLANQVDDVFLTTFLALMFAMLSVRGLYLLLNRAGTPRVKWPTAVTVVGLIMFWGFPPMADVIRSDMMSTPAARSTLTLLTTMSPGGLIGATWGGGGVAPWAGLGIQALVAVFLTVVGTRAARRWDPATPAIIAPA